MKLSPCVTDWVKRIQKKVNAERKELGLPPLSQHAVVAECVQSVMVQKTAYIGSVFIRPSVDDEQ
ncbi:TPA: hypothetical protein SLO96_002971 [Proteus mirabilis]|nr:hypothetical protein [Proteus mirabilis]